MGRLIVADILRSYRETIYTILHQTVEFMDCRDCSSENIEITMGLIVPQDNLLTPVAENICLKTRRILCAVTSLYRCKIPKIHDCIEPGQFPVGLGDMGSVK